MSLPVCPLALIRREGGGLRLPVVVDASSAPAPGWPLRQPTGARADAPARSTSASEGPMGTAILTIMAAFAQLERDIVVFGTPRAPARACRCRC